MVFLHSPDTEKERASLAAIEAGHAETVNSLLPRIAGQKQAKVVATRLEKTSQVSGLKLEKVSLATKAESHFAEAVQSNEPNAYAKCVRELRILKSKALGLPLVRTLVFLARAQNLIGEHSQATGAMHQAAKVAAGIKRPSDRAEANICQAAGWFALGERTRAEAVVERSQVLT